jgi:hypothetical protein
MTEFLRSAKVLLLAYAACLTPLIGSIPALAQFGGGETAEEKAARAARVEEAERRLTFVKNAKPNWVGFDDLNDLIKGCGSFEDAGIEDELWGFVHFGGPENAAKARNGDHFIQEDAKKAAQGHRAGLAKRQFFLRLRTYSWVEDESTNRSVVLKTSSPGCRVTTKLNAVVPCDLPERFDPAHLTPDGRLEVAAWTIKDLKAQGLEVYVPESLISFLRIHVSGQREVLEAIAREPDRHVVIVGLTNLQLQAADQYGWFRHEHLVTLGHSTQQARGRFNAGLDGGDRPNYLVTKVRKRPDDPAFPLVVNAEIVRIQIVRREPDGRAKVVFEEK